MRTKGNFVLSEEEEKALYSLLYNINLEILHDTGEIELTIKSPITKEDGKIIFEMFYGADFGGIPNDTVSNIPFP